LLKQVKEFKITLHDKTGDFEKRIQLIEKDIVMLKKKQNLPELEHRVNDRIDSVVRVLKASFCEKSELVRKFRILDNRIESLLEIVVMQLVGDPQEMREVVLRIKGSKKLKHPSMLVAYMKSQQKLLN